MGRPSNQRFSARRPGQRERTRIKKRFRMSAVVFGGYTDEAVGHEPISITLKAGRKKWREAMRSVNPNNPFSVTAHLTVTR